MPSLSANVVHRLRWASRRESKVHGDSVVLIDLPDWLFIADDQSALCRRLRARISVSKPRFRLPGFTHCS